MGDWVGSPSSNPYLAVKPLDRTAVPTDSELLVVVGPLLPAVGGEVLLGALDPAVFFGAWGHGLVPDQSSKTRDDLHRLVIFRGKPIPARRGLSLDSCRPSPHVEEDEERSPTPVRGLSAILPSNSPTVPTDSELVLVEGHLCLAGGAGSLPLPLPPMPLRTWGHDYLPVREIGPAFFVAKAFSVSSLMTMSIFARSFLGNPAQLANKLLGKVPM